MDELPPFLIVGDPAPAVLEPLVRAFQEHADVVQVKTAAEALENIGGRVASCVVVDPALADMNAWDLCGWVRARWRDLPLMVIDHPEVDLSALLLEEHGAVWTIPDALRSRMTDPSVLRFDPADEGGYSPEAVAEQLGITVAEVERDLAESLEKLGYDTVGEMRFHMRNAPANLDELEAPVHVRFEPGPIAQA